MFLGTWKIATNIYSSLERIQKSENSELACQADLLQKLQD